MRMVMRTRLSLWAEWWRWWWWWCCCCAVWRRRGEAHAIHTHSQEWCSEVPLPHAKPLTHTPRAPLLTSAFKRPSSIWRVLAQIVAHNLRTHFRQLYVRLRLTSRFYTVGLETVPAWLGFLCMQQIRLDHLLFKYASLSVHISISHTCQCTWLLCCHADHSRIPECIKNWENETWALSISLRGSKKNRNVVWT